MIAIRFLISIILFGSVCHASDKTLLFFDEEESGLVNSSSQIDGEYYSDILAFGISIENDLLFMNSKNGYDIMVGSLGSKRFSIQQRLKLNHLLRPGISLSVRYLELENFEIARKQLVAGFDFNLHKYLKLRLYTSLFSEKSNNDLGASAVVTLNSKDRLEFFINYPDFSFNKRNEVNSRNNKSTLNYGLRAHRKIDDKFEIEIYALRNSELLRENLNTGQVYQFSETRLGFSLSKIFNHFKIQSLTEFFHGEEGFFMPANPEVTDKEGLRQNTSFEFGNWMVGLEFNYRKWEVNQEKVFHRNHIPFLWHKVKFNSLLSSIDLGLDTSFHSSSGPLPLRNEEDKAETDVNGRFNLRLNFKISNESFLNLLLSLDLDDGSWEGGGGQFQARF